MSAKSGTALDITADPLEIKQEILKKYPAKVARKRAKQIIINNPDDGNRVPEIMANTRTIPGILTMRGCAYAGCKGVVLGPTRDILQITHGPIGCGFYSWLTRRNQTKPTTAEGTNFMPYAMSTDMQEEEIIFGGEKKLKKAIEEAIHLFHPKAIGIFSTCPVGLIGDDVHAVAREMEEKYPEVNIFGFSCEGYKGVSQSAGHHIANNKVFSEVVGQIEMQQIEACPRRWSLMSSDYPAIWDKNGYPEPLIQSTLIGRVTHRLVEIIVKEFQCAGCTSFDNPDCIRVMRELGGFSRIIGKIFDDVLIQYAENPRAAGTLAVIKKALLERKSDIRENARILLSRIFEGKQTAQCVSLVSQGKAEPLRNGIYSEVQLVNEEIKWKGVADLIRLTPEECEIRDFKTGVHKEEHAEQLRIYNLLWLCDNRKNPSARPTSKLTISYIDADVDVPPLLISEVGFYKDKLINLTNEAKKKVMECPPEAILNEDNCRHCFVRHLCTPYWEKGLPKMFAKEKSANSLIDIAVRIVGIHGSRSYDAVTIASSNLPQNMPLILRISENCNFKRGNCLRLLNFSMKRDETNEDNEQVVISPSKISEFYFMPDS